MQSGCNPYFLIQEEYRKEISESLTITSNVIERMIRQGQFSMSKIAVQISHELATTKISLCLDNFETYTISRFPRSLLQDDSFQKGSNCLFFPEFFTNHSSFSMSVSRQNFNKNSSRWVSRTTNHQTRRKQWIPPDSTQNAQGTDTISRYSDPNYVLGNSTPAAVGWFARLFKSGFNPKDNRNKPRTALELADTSINSSLPKSPSPRSSLSVELNQLHIVELPSSSEYFRFELDAIDTECRSLNLDHPTKDRPSGTGRQTSRLNKSHSLTDADGGDPYESTSNAPNDRNMTTKPSERMEWDWI